MEQTLDMQAGKPARGRMDTLIVETATALYEERGVRNVSLTDIAEEGQFTRTAIYYYFDGKDDVTECVLGGYIQRAVTAILRNVEDDEDGDIALCLIKNLRAFLYEDDGSMTKAYTIMTQSGQQVWAVAALVDDLTDALCRVGVLARPRRKYRANQGQDIMFALTAVMGLLIAKPEMPDDDLAVAFRASLGIHQ